MKQRALVRHCMLAAAFVAWCCVLLVHAAEPRIIPTVHATLEPTSAIQVPLRFIAAHTNVWRSDLEQRMLLSGGVQVAVGYRSLKADDAAVWLTPSREAGERTFDVAIYLSGHVEVREGNSANSTRTVGKELLVTTRISQAVQLEGDPVNQAVEDSPIVKRGSEIRNEIATRPLTPLHVARMVITTNEKALQAGWIARGPNNLIVPGPGDIEITRDAEGNIVTTPATQVAKKPRPKPTVFISFDPGSEVQVRRQGTEEVGIYPGVYVHYDFQDGKAPIDFRAQRAVTFGPVPADASTAPATAKGTAAATAPASELSELSKVVTGIYLEGDVTLDQGDKIAIRAERMYFDLTSQRAVMLDATLASVDEVRNVPVYMRAGEIRQLARGEFAAKKVEFSTSEFYTPHYHIGASEVYLRDITPQLQGPGGGGGGAGGGGESGGEVGFGGDISAKTFQFQVKDATMNVEGVPIFYWPFLGGDTSKNEVPLRTLRVSNSKTYGLTLLTDWDLFGLMGQPEPEGVRADLNVDYFGKRGPAGGVQSSWLTDTDHGILRSYALLDQGTDRLGKDRSDVNPNQDGRGRITVRDQHDLGDGWTLQLEGSYISDPTFLEQFFQQEFDTDKEHETSAYLKKQGQTDAISVLVSGNAMDFTSTADQVDDQFSTDKIPEVKYWRIGDSLLDIFTYYSENSAAEVHTSITDFTPSALGLEPAFISPPASAVPKGQTYRSYLESLGWNTGEIFRADSRHELDMPLQVGDAKITPYVTGRVTVWDTGFPEGNGGSTTRVWGGGGIRSSMQFWRVYADAESRFFDVHEIRHVIEPQFNVFVQGSDQDRRDLQPFDRSVEGISGASGTQLSINQKWQTKRGGEGNWRNVDWLVLNVSWNQFWNKDKAGLFFPGATARGFYFASRPELSLATSSINVDGTWRIGERMRLMGDANYSLDSHRIEQAAAGFAVDQTSTLSYFLGNRYVNELHTDQWTIAADYQLTQKYRLIASESFDTLAGQNILTSVTLVRRMPRLNAALTVTYDANQAETSVVFTMWPEGFPQTTPGTYAAGGDQR